MWGDFEMSSYLDKTPYLILTIRIFKHWQTCDSVLIEPLGMCDHESSKASFLHFMTKNKAKTFKAFRGRINNMLENEKSSLLSALILSVTHYSVSSLENNTDAGVCQDVGNSRYRQMISHVHCFTVTPLLLQSLV